MNSDVLGAPPSYCRKRNKQQLKQYPLMSPPPPHPPPPTSHGHNGPLRRGNSVCSCVRRCECLCMCVCVFVWHGWPEECSGSRLAEPSQWTGSFTLQGNSTPIRRERGREREGDAKANCLKNNTFLSKTVASLFSFVFNLHLFFPVSLLTGNTGTKTHQHTHAQITLKCPCKFLCFALSLFEMKVLEIKMI